MIYYCSYKFSRDEAKEHIITDEINDKEELINKFIEAYKDLRIITKQY